MKIHLNKPAIDQIALQSGVAPQVVQRVVQAMGTLAARLPTYETQEDPQTGNKRRVLTRQWNPTLHILTLRWVLPGKTRPEGMPSHPNMVYRDTGWVSWPEFLGVGRDPSEK